MRALKFALFLALVGAWSVGWDRRAEVVEAYTDTRAPVELRLDGVDVSARAGAAGVSPHRLALVDGPSEASLGFEPDAAQRSAVAIEGGAASLTGSVVDQSGAVVAGAVVRVERVTSRGSGVIDVVADESGQWELADLLGGRFRVRAFVPGTLRTIRSDVVSLGPEEAAVISSVVGPPSEELALALAGPEELVSTVDATVAVVVSRQTVDADGLVVWIPEPSVVVEVTVDPPLTLLSERSVFADGGGAARFRLDCPVGRWRLTASIGGVGRSLELPPCVPEAAEPDDGEGP